MDRLVIPVASLWYWKLGSSHCILKKKKKVCTLCQNILFPVITFLPCISCEMKCFLLYALPVNKPFPNANFWPQGKQIQLFGSHQLQPSLKIGASHVALVVKNSPANAWYLRNLGSIPGSERSPGEENGNPLQYSCLENPMDIGARWLYSVGSKRDTRTWVKWLSSAQRKCWGAGVMWEAAIWHIFQVLHLLW